MPVSQGSDRTEIISQITRSACEMLQKKITKSLSKNTTHFSRRLLPYPVDLRRRPMRLTKGAAENTKPVARNPKVKAKRKQQQDK